MKRRALLVLAMFLNACAPASQGDLASRAVIADTTLPPIKSFPARSFPLQPVSNQALTLDFLELSFKMESGRQLPVFTRFEGDITLRVTGSPPETMLPDLRGLLTRLRDEAGISITPVSNGEANITIQAVSRNAIRKTLPQAACFVAPNVSSLSQFKNARRSPKTNWATLKTRKKVAIIVPNDVSPQEMRDCLHEELAQALGPLNDLYRLPNTVFNDDNVHTVLTDFDMMILRMTYAPQLASGMNYQEVASALPLILNKINPSGNYPDKRLNTATPLAYGQAIQTALGPGTDPAARHVAADEALRIAISSGWTDNRRAFAHYTKARLLQSTNALAAKEQYLRADVFYAQNPEPKLHRAYVATQLSAFALADGNPRAAQNIATPYIAVARRSQNAALLSTLQLLRAEALEAQGRVKEARALRLDSLGWARYGFGADWAVRAKLREISALTPSKPPV